MKKIKDLYIAKEKFSNINKIEKKQTMKNGKNSLTHIRIILFGMRTQKMVFLEKTIQIKFLIGQRRES